MATPTLKSNGRDQKLCKKKNIWAPSSEFVSSSIPSWQILTAHAQPFRGARDLAFCLKVPLDSLLVWASSKGSGETARMRRLAWTFAARIGYKYQIRLTRSISWCFGVDRKICPWGSLSGITWQSLVMPNSDPWTFLSIHTSHSWKILIIFYVSSLLIILLFLPARLTKLICLCW